MITAGSNCNLHSRNLVCLVLMLKIVSNFGGDANGWDCFSLYMPITLISRICSASSFHLGVVAKIACSSKNK